MADYLQQALDRLSESNIEEAKSAALIFHNLVRPTSVYRGGIAELKEGAGLVGFPVRTFGKAFRKTLESLDYDNGAVTGLGESSHAYRK